MIVEWESAVEVQIRPFACVTDLSDDVTDLSNPRPISDNRVPEFVRSRANLVPVDVMSEQAHHSRLDATQSLTGLFLLTSQCGEFAV